MGPDSMTRQDRVCLNTVPLGKSAMPGAPKVRDFVVLCGSIGQSAAIRAIRWYQRTISAHNPPCCKYYPSCSNYALQSFERYGLLRGGLLSLLRLLRCRPWSLGGIDDVPQRFSLFYRFSWSKAHEEPRLTPLVSGEKETA